jgi:two-component system nitrate/nitrite sensor histidine kinase NarX
MPAPETPADTLDHPGAGEVLADLAAGLAAGDDLRSLLQRLLQPLVRLAGAAGGAVRVLDPRLPQLHLLGGIGLPREVMQGEQAVEDGCGVCGSALADRRPRWAEDLAPCSRRHDGRWFGQGCQRVLAVPLHSRGRVLGLINLFFDGRQQPVAEVLSLLETIGPLLGLALDNARLERESLEATVLHERQALAADVHDSIGQSLAFVKMRLPLLQDAIAACRQDEAERLFGDVRHAVGQAHASLRGVLSDYRAPADPLGLSHALQVAAQAFRQHCAVDLELQDMLPRGWLRSDQESQAAHIVQEALLNIARHSGASKAWVQVGAAGPSTVTLCVEDNGSGLPAAASAVAAGTGDGGSHYGLSIMRERARRLGGHLQVGPREGGGTCIRVEFPRLPGTRAGMGVH